MTNVDEALNLYADYQERSNLGKYARVSIARVTEFLEQCKSQGVHCVEEITTRHIRDYLKLTPKKQMPGAWKSRYTAIKVFFNYLVFINRLKPQNNPMQSTPSGESLTNKRMMSPIEFDELLLVIPDTHWGTHDWVCCQLLWHGYTLQDINKLTIDDRYAFPLSVRERIDQLLAARQHIPTRVLFLTKTGQPQYIHGQKLNRRLQKYAEQAWIMDAKRISSSLLYQSGAYHRLANPNL